MGSVPEQAMDLRPYVLTGGRTSVSDHELPIEALIIARSVDGSPTSPESRAILAVTRDGYLSIAEIAVAVRLPIGVIRVLVADLVDAGLVSPAGVPTGEVRRHPRHLLEQVLDGIQRL